MGKYMYMVGNDSKKLQCYMIKEKTWQFKCSVPSHAPRTLASCMLHLDGCLYLVGGYQLCARYTINTDSWTLLNAPRLQHSYGSAAVSGNKIYLLGHNDTENTDVEEYDIEKDEWTTTGLKLPQYLSFCTAAMVAYL